MRHVADFENQYQKRRHRNKIAATMDGGKNVNVKTFTSNQTFET